MAFDFQFQADFADGSSFVQDDEDVSHLNPGQSSYEGDFVSLDREKTATRVRLAGDSRVISVDLERERFRVDGVEVTLGGELPDGVEWVQSGHPVNAKKAVYFRNIQHNTGSVRVVTVQHCLGFLAKDGAKHILGVR